MVSLYSNAMRIIKRTLLFFIFSVCCLSCSTQDSENITPLPPVTVDLKLNLTNFAYQSLRNNGGFVTLPNEGVKGIIIYRESSIKYIAYEKLCPYRSEDLTCTEVETDAVGFGFIDKCCSSKFDLNGFPVAGPAQAPLYTYSTAINGDFLFISN